MVSPHGQVIRAAARFARVERIFVHPLIKRALCWQFAGQKWLHKIRPWWGHYQHFYITTSKMNVRWRSRKG